MKKLLLTILLGGAAVVLAQTAEEKPVTSATLAEIQSESVADYERVLESPAFKVTGKDADLDLYLKTAVLEGKKGVVDYPSTKAIGEQIVGESCMRVLESMGVDVNTKLAQGSIVCEQEIRERAKEQGLDVKSLQK